MRGILNTYTHVLIKLMQCKQGNIYICNIYSYLLN